MFYRLPFLFATTYYFSLFLIQMTSLLFERNFVLEYINFSYCVLQSMVYNITSFFFILILSCLFFYQSKLYFYTFKNKQKVMVFAVILAILYFLIKNCLLELAYLFILPKLINAVYLHGNDLDFSLGGLLAQSISVIVYMWSFVIIALVFYLMVKWSKSYFQIPLIDGITSAYQNDLFDGQQINSDIIEKDYRKLYAIIFSSVFCCVSHGLVWNAYFVILSAAIGDFKIAISEYYEMIFCSAILMIAFNYWFLYQLANRKIVKTYSWIPLSSLLTASAITLVLFGIIMLFISCVIFPFVFAFNSLIILGLWFVISYVILYLLSCFALKRYFA